MLGPRGVALLALLASAIGGCTAGGGTRHDSGPTPDTGTPRVDSGPETCTTAAECDDSIACTIDECVVGNVCRHDPLDGRCNTAIGERCVVGQGCMMGMPTDCETAADCQDGNVCNGEEQCIRGGCFIGTDLNCSDGNACTDDSCDPASGCMHELVCDAGGRTDGGTPCPTFDASMHYSATFLMLPAQSCGGGGGSYSVDTLSFSVSGGTLTVNAGTFTLTQTPAPTGPSFDVSGSNGCANVRITGTFACANRFTGTWTANHSGGCAACGFSSESIEGVR